MSLLHSSVCTYKNYGQSYILPYLLPQLIKMVTHWNPQIPRLFSSFPVSLKHDFKLLVGLNQDPTRVTRSTCVPGL